MLRLKHSSRAGVLQLAANKQQLSREGVGFLRNELSLAHYNVSPTLQPLAMHSSCSSCGAGVLQLAANKQQLSREGVGFLRNELSLAHYNVSPTTQLTLSTRSRGRTK